MDPSASSLEMTALSNRFDLHRLLKIPVALFGLFWLINAGFQFSGWVWQPDDNGETNLLHVFGGAMAHAPAWLRPYLVWVTDVVRGMGPHQVALGMVTIALLLGLSLISRVGTSVACVLGIVYSLLCWVSLCALGYPYGGGQTDPSVFPAYIIAFVFVLSVLPAISRDPQAARPREALWTTGRLLFGLLWGFDAVLKWQPYFLTHFLDQLIPASQGQPAWIAAYIGLVITIVKAVGPLMVAVVVAMIETLFSISLLTGRWMRMFVPAGFLYSLAVWTTAEGWGGPYSSAGTGVRGNVLGNILIYALIYLFLLVPLLQRTPEWQPPGARFR